MLKNLKVRNKMFIDFIYLDKTGEKFHMNNKEWTSKNHKKSLGKENCACWFLTKFCCRAFYFSNGKHFRIPGRN